MAGVVSKMHYNLMGEHVKFILKYLLCNTRNFGDGNYEYWGSGYSIETFGAIYEVARGV